MKRYSRGFLMMSLVLFLTAILPVFVQAQPSEPPCVGPDPIYGDCPIDSGVIFLLVAGAAYGIKIVVDSRKASVVKG